jgi:deoxycytidylate deaminase
VKLEGAKLYVTLSPCRRCASNLIQVGVSEVIFEEGSAYPEVIEELKSAGIPIRQFTGNSSKY